MCLDCITSHRVCLGDENYRAFLNAIEGCRGEEPTRESPDMRHGPMSAEEEDIEHFDLVEFLEHYVEKKMCVMRKLGLAKENNQPNRKAVQESMSNTRFNVLIYVIINN